MRLRFWQKRQIDKAQKRKGSDEIVVLGGPNGEVEVYLGSLVVAVMKAWYFEHNYSNTLPLEKDDWLNG